MAKFSRRTIIAAPLAGAAIGIVSGAGAASNEIDDDLPSLEARRQAARKMRDFEASRSDDRPIERHPTNGDEHEITENGEPTYIGNFTKGLLHNKYGEVVPDRYQKLLDALESGDPDKFEDITLSDLPEGVRPAELSAKHLSAIHDLVRRPHASHRLHGEMSFISDDIQRLRLTNPQAGLAFDLEGCDSHELSMPPPPSFRSKEIIGEIAEDYWMALLRDVPFSKYATDPTAAKALANLNLYNDFKGPKVQGKVTVDTLFRGGVDQTQIGPYVSQFLVAPIPFGAYIFDQKILFSYFDPAKGGDPVYLTDAESWLDAQNGKVSSDSPQIQIEHGETLYTYVHRGRDLANFVHIDELFQAYLNAALILGAPKVRGGYGALHNVGNPYDGYDWHQPGRVRRSTQDGFGTMGEPAFKSMIGEIATRALKAVWFEKWFMHRRLRPETFAGRIHFHKMDQLGKDGKTYPLDQDEFLVLNRMLPHVRQYNISKNGDDSYFLPMAFPEGAPTHPAYGAGHATVAGACVTLIKAFYETDLSYDYLGIPIYVVSDDGKKLKDISDENPDLAEQMTLTGELNKLACNISLGRNFAGVHWRSDHIESLRLGEKVALRFLQETADTHNENVSFRLRKFDGSRITVSKTPIEMFGASDSCR